jgi:hypothetical protein
LSPGLFYEWQKKAMENLVVALEAGRSERTSKTQALEKKIENLEGKLAHKDSVMAELLSEYVALKKNLGGPDRPLGSPRYAGRGGGLRRALVGEVRAACPEAGGVAGVRTREVLCVAPALWRVARV